jgi:hypothetical protein
MLDVDQRFSIMHSTSGESPLVLQLPTDTADMLGRTITLIQDTWGIQFSPADATAELDHSSMAADHLCDSVTLARCDTQARV